MVFLEVHIFNISDIHPCTEDPCINGVCTDVDGEKTCICDAGYTGVNCSTGQQLTYVSELTTIPVPC